MKIQYITTRELSDSKGRKRGRVRIIKMVESEYAEVDFICPECGFEERKKERWGPPFVEGSGMGQKFNIICKRCGYSVKLHKLRKEIKKRR